MAATAESVRPPVWRGPERFLAEMQACWGTLADSTERLAEAAAPVRGAEPPSGSFAELRAASEAITRALIVEPVEQFLRLRPIRRSLEAMQECDQETDRKALRSRVKIDSRFQRLLAETALDLCEPWRIRRSGEHADEWKDWDERRAAHTKQAADLLGRYEKWVRGFTKPGTGPGDDKKRTARLETWWRQNRAVTSTLETELALRDLGLVWYNASEQLVSDLRRERQEILGLTERMGQWVGGGDTAGPVEILEVSSPEERMRTWALPTEEAAAKRLPEKMELVEPGWRTGWRPFAAREIFLSTFNTLTKSQVSGIVSQYWGRSAEIVREVARSKEIIDYWRETAAGHSSESEALLSEARQNASAMLAEQLQAAGEPDRLDEQFVTAIRAWGAQGSTVIEARQHGWFSLLRRPRGRRLFRVALHLAKEQGLKRLHTAARWGAGQWDRVLETVGGKIPERPALAPVVRRSTLLDILALPASKTDLPAIYRLLFRIAPIEDRRFLIGRDRELEGITQALRDWDSGRFAACLVVGARGSGKTSLLNCAASGAFLGRKLIRAQFHDRMDTPPEIDSFLRGLLGVAEDANLEAVFASEKRILMIEECERTYLRKVGGFEGASYLMHLIHRTAATTLWVLVLNDKAFRVLDAGVQFGRVFSHRINAMNVSRADLESAILERHRLSGLRLEFAPPPEVDPRIARVKEILGLEDPPQKLFFNSLYQQSAGVFRSAFELWLSSIDRVEAETLKIRQPLEPAFAKFRSELQQEDHFTLMAIQEHGSLTQQEVAAVLCENEEYSRSRMDRMLALGLIEQDPEHPGFRVRPDATRFTNDVLRRVNLI